MESRPKYSVRPKQDPCSAPRGVLVGMLVSLALVGALFGIFEAFSHLGGSFKIYPEAWFGIISSSAMIGLSAVCFWHRFRTYQGGWSGYLWLITILLFLLARCIYTVWTGR